MGEPFVGIQIGAISFVEEGTENVITYLREKARVNTLLIASYGTYTTGGQAFHSVESEAVPDHGNQLRYQFYGGLYNKLHEQYFGSTSLRDIRTRDEPLRNVDVFELVTETARKAGMQIYAWIVEYLPSWVPNAASHYEVDLDGLRTGLPFPLSTYMGTGCLNNPDYRNMYLSLVESCVREYDIDGIVFGFQRAGPLGNLVAGVRTLTCFCEFCRSKAATMGVDARRAIEGYRQLLSLAQSASSPIDGHFATFLRILLRYPEILAWNHLMHVSELELMRDIYSTVKAVDAKKKVGWHIWHAVTYNPIVRAETDYSVIKSFADWVKPVLYHDPAGIRLRDTILSIQRSTLRELLPDELLNSYYRIAGFEGPGLGDLPTQGLGEDYIVKETSRVVASVGPAVRVYPGIGINVPTATYGRELPAGKRSRQTTPEDVKIGIRSALQAGAHGVVLSRMYSEMELRNLAAVGEALREIESTH